ncbi:hypothetical protein Tco_0555269, partial [Tanacetum coccineum]
SAISRIAFLASAAVLVGTAPLESRTKSPPASQSNSVEDTSSRVP